METQFCPLILLFNNLIMYSEYYTVCAFNSAAKHEEDSYFSIRKDGMDGDKGVSVFLKAIKLT